MVERYLQWERLFLEQQEQKASSLASYLLLLLQGLEVEQYPVHQA